MIHQTGLGRGAGRGDGAGAEPNRDDQRLRCSVDGRVLDGRTRDMIFSVPELVARISAVSLMLPGDLMFTGTPPGRGWGGSRRHSSGLVRRW